MPDHAPVDAVSVCPCCAAPEVTGGAVFVGGIPATTGVGADSAVLEPAPFVAITSTTSVDPTSAETSVYADAVAPAMFEQLVPPLVQRRHWKAYEIGAVPVQAPVDAVSVCPSVAVPEIVGGAVFAGGAAAATWAVCADSAVLEPAALVAVTSTRTVVPTSAEPSVYVDAVAPPMSLHDEPPASQLRHW